MTTGQAPDGPDERPDLGSPRPVEPVGVVLALVAAVVVLGPALRPGVVLAYDLAWSPDARLTPFATGVDTPAPRAVPSDAVAWLLGLLVTPAVAQKLVLAGVLVLAGLGAAALVRMVRPGAGRLAACAAVLAAEWNPFVAERLVIGQWTVLIGYAVLPWAVRAAIRVRRGQGSVTALCGWAVLAAAGGANSLVLVGPPVVVLLLLPRPVWRAVVAWLGVVAGGAAAWAVPALVSSAPSDPAGFGVFAARSDGPLGLAVSLAGGGGFWNPAAYPSERGVGALAAAAALLTTAGVVATARSAVGRATAALAFAGLLLVLASGTPVLADGWQRLAHLPGGPLLRDSQKLVALWVVVGAVGVGLLVDALARRGGALWAPAMALAVVAPLLLPNLAWGARGRLEAVTVPADLRRAATELSQAPSGEVGLLPWRQYRRYGWNDSRVSLSLVPRMVDQRVLYDDSLPLSSGRIAGESRRAAAVTAAIDSGTSPWDAVVARGVRYVIIEKDTGLDAPVPPPGAARTIADSSHVLLVEVVQPSDAPSAPPAGDADPDADPDPDPVADPDAGVGTVVGWGVTCATLAAWLVLAVRRGLRRNGSRNRTRW
ncbi:hypothetical protein SAMN04489867_1197 [Pedococcus dokdonensis]|uniref:Uncharacterized protein n=1 Tax=Pedococcus dokdonensis TaxID=443156 RepID=A0A1H0PAK0_9MICO|nr:hypothetical protein [Pedococcus dokdonensis]SDP02053.1 hypothetical protein SAMN04489867_1197 [Pedococcus dokdonensis]